VVHDHVDLLRQLAVQLGNDRLDRLVGIPGNDPGVDERLFRKRADGLLDRLAGLVRLRLELPVEQRRELAGLGQRRAVKAELQFVDWP